MTQKILAGRADDPNLSGDLVRVKVDQVVLSREPSRPLIEAAALGMKRCAVELAVGYETRCVTAAAAPDPESAALERVSRAALAAGVLLARPGIGYPAAVHLERFGSPARLALTDDPRLASAGGAGMLPLVVSPGQLADALVHGSAWVRNPRSVQVLLSGRMRPFVCVRDIALELIRRGLGDVVRRIDDEHAAPVVIEFAGASARLLSVADRAVLCALAPQLGAAAALFVSDEKTEVYLRDQRRSKAHRGLVPDPGAPCDDAISVDLSAVDPLLLDEDGVVKPVRELAGKSVNQAILGGDSGASLRDLLAAAALLKSKRVPPTLEFLLSPPSRQALEVLAQSGALVDLIATGARLIEPDLRVVTGDLYPPSEGGVSLRTFDPEPRPAPSRGSVVGSAETLAYAVATGEVGDPRSFKRPVRVTVPRTLPTDDVLIVRKGKTSKGKTEGDSVKPAASTPTADAPRHRAPATVAVIKERRVPNQPSALVLTTLDDVRWAAALANDLAPHTRAVLAPHVPSPAVALFSAAGILALKVAAEDAARLGSEATIELPAIGSESRLSIGSSAGPVDAVWVASGLERDWTITGHARIPVGGKPSR
jgi:aconitate hydratase